MVGIVCGTIEKALAHVANVKTMMTKGIQVGVFMVVVVLRVVLLFLLLAFAIILNLVVLLLVRLGWPTTTTMEVVAEIFVAR